MARGTSGRVVIEVNPVLKERLYSALAMENQTLKDWFVANAQQFLKSEKAGTRTPAARRAETLKVQA